MTDKETLCEDYPNLLYKKTWVSENLAGGDCVVSVSDNLCEAEKDVWWCNGVFGFGYLWDKWLKKW
jgi:hypothetical protein